MVIDMRISQIYNGISTRYNRVLITKEGDKMDSILNKLGIYDLLGYLIPGFIGIYSLKIIYVDIFNLANPIKLSDGFLGAVILLVLGYYIGTLMHELSQVVQECVMKKLWGGLPSEKYLLKEDKQCSEEEKSSYYKLASELYQIEEDNYTKKKSQLVFDRFRTALQISGKDEKSQLFNAYYGMYRNFAAGTLFCAAVDVIYIGVMLIEAFVLKMPVSFEYMKLLDGALFIAATCILFRRTRRFGETYVKYVFRGFYEVHKQNIKKLEK